jgi:hypothetical protein
MTHYLIVANRTLASPDLLDEVRARMRAGACDFYVIVPASHPSRTLTWLEAADRAAAQERLDVTRLELRLEGAQVDGAIGDANPLDAVADVVAERPIDHVIVSTFPARWSRWLKQDLPRKVRASFNVPVTHVVERAHGAGAHRVEYDRAASLVA